MQVLPAVDDRYAHLLGRKGAARMAAIPAEVLSALHVGAIPTANLNEFLAIDLRQLAPVVAQAIGLDPTHERLHDTLAMLESFKPMKRHGLVAHALYDMVISAAERPLLTYVMARYQGNISHAAQALGITRFTLRTKLRAYGLIEPPKERSGP